jgi:hypothetical protein
MLPSSERTRDRDEDGVDRSYRSPTRFQRSHLSCIRINHVRVLVAWEGAVKLQMDRASIPWLTFALESISGVV